MKTSQVPSRLVVLFSIFLSAGAAVKAQIVSNAPPVIVVNGSTPGYYNAALGTILDGSAPQFPLPFGTGDDPVIYPAAEPNLAAASGLLGNWLTPGTALNSSWQQLSTIPSDWALNTETAIIYEVNGGAYGFTNLFGDFDADNGLYVWVNGQYKFGARSPGLPSPPGQFEYTNIFLGNLSSGTNRIQILREDSGITSGSQVRITGNPNAGPNPMCTSISPGPVSWWRAEGNSLDSIRTNHGAAVGGVTIVPGKVGNGFGFDGSGYILVPHHPSLSFSNTLTIELWYKSTQSNDVYYGILDKRTVPSGANYGINVAASVGLGVYYDDAAVFDGDDTPYGSTFEASRYAPAPEPGAFHHLAATYFQISNNLVQLETYLDGQLVRTRYISGNLGNTLNTAPVTIGATAQGAGEFFRGVIDEVAIYNRVLSAAEIQSIYAADAVGKCPATNPPPVSCVNPPSGLVSWWKAESAATDPVNGNNGTLQNGTTYVPGEVGQGFGFNGTDSYVNIPSSETLKPTGAFAFEAWIKYSGNPGAVSSYCIAAKGIDAEAAMDWALTVSANHRLRPHVNVNGSWHYFDCSTPLSAGTWYHVAMIYDGEHLQGYVNGALDGSANVAGSVQTSDAPLRIGAYAPVNGTGSRAFFTGSIDEVAFYNRNLSAGELFAIFNAGSAGKCPPSLPFNPADGLIAHYPFNGNAADVSGNGNHGVPSNAVLAADRFGSPNAAFSFNGQNAAITVPDNSALRSLSSNYTFNAWVRFGSNPQIDAAILMKSAGAGDQRKWTFWQHVQAPPYGIGLLLNRPPGGQFQWNNNYPFTTNQWFMVTFSASAANTLIAVDGQVVSAQSGNLVLPDTTGVAMSIGGAEPGGNQWFTGLLDDIRIYNRTFSSNDIAQLYQMEAGQAPPPVSCVNVPAGLVSWWRADGTGSDDGGGHDGTALNGAGFTAGKVGAALSLDGLNDHFRVADQPDLRLSTGLTIEAWVFPTRIDANHCIVSKWDAVVGPDQRSYSVALQPDGRAYLGVSPTGTDFGSAAVFSSNALPVNQWTHLAVTYDGAALRMYLNGVVENHTAYTNGIFPGTSDLGIGANVGGTATGDVSSPFAALFAGKIDEMAIFNRALNPNEINTIFLAGSAGKCPVTNLPPPQVAAVPVITSLNPTVATVGNSVIISGTNFSPVASNNIVYFGAVRAGVTTASANSLTVTVPGGATHAPITVTVDKLTAAAPAAFLPSFVGSGSNITASSFAPGQNLTGADGPFKTIIADIDGDGKPDLVEDNAYAHNISLFRNISVTGTLDASSFAPRIDFPALGGTDSPRCMAVADVDGDGKLDVLVGDQATSSVLVYRNIATLGTLTTGSLAAPVSFAAGSYPHGLRVADLNGDGLPEILVANHSGNSLSILRNLGTAGSLTTNSFAPQYVLATGPNPTDVAIADFNGDGKPDLVTTAFGGSQLSVFRNVATPGTAVSNWFTLDTMLPALSGSLEFAVADMDGDAKSDLVVASVHGYAVSVYRNQAGAGAFSSNSFAARVDFATPGWVHNVAVADLNGDTKPDLAVTGELNSYMAVFQNQSTPGSFTTGSLAARVDYATGWNAWGVAVGDLDGDNRADIVFANSYDDTLTLYRNIVAFGTITNQPPNTNPPPQVVTIPAITSFNPAATTAGSSVIIAGTNFSPAASNNIVYFGAVRAAVTAASSNLLTVTVPIGATHAPITVTVDGLTAAARTAFTPTFAGGAAISTASFSPRVNLGAGDGPTGTAIADFDGDGKPDIAVTDDYGHTLSVYRNISVAGTLDAGSFAPRVVLSASAADYSPYMLVTGDVDGDGKLDLITTDIGGNTVSVYRNQATPGSLSSNSFAPFVLFNTGVGPRTVALVDLDADGRPEIVTANYGGSTVSVLRNTGVAGLISSNSFAPRFNLPAGAGAHGLAVTDLDGDGRPDLATANAVGASMSLFRNVGSGPVASNSFAPAVTISGPDNAHFVRAADLDADGRAELLLTSYLGQTLTVYRNQADPGVLNPSSFAPGVTLALAGRGHTISLGDLNGDARPDVAVDTEIGDSIALFQNQSVPGGFTNDSLAARVDLVAGWNAWGSSVGDLDGDGRPDIIFANTYDDNLSIYRNVTALSNLPPASCVTAPSGLAGWWRAEGDTTDAVGTNTATLLNGTGFGSGLVGQTFTFDGSDDSVRVPAGGSLDVGIGAGLTIETWIKPTRLTIGPIVEWNNGAGGEGMHLWHSVDTVVAGDGPGNLYGNLVDTSGVSHHIVSPSGLLATNTFHHVALTYDRATGIAVIYHNGVAVRTENLGSFTPRTGYDLHFGRRPSGPFSGDLFQGQIDEVSLYNRALTATEIQAIAAVGSGGKCVGTNQPVPCVPGLPDMVGWWQAEGNTTDSITGNNGTLQGGASYASGQVGQAFVLNGADAGVRIEASAALDVGTQAGLTAEAWILPANITAGGPIIEWSRDTAGSPYGAHLWAGHPSRNPGYFLANLADTDGNWRVIEKDGALVANVYQHVAVTYNRSNGVARLFVNGAMVQESNLGIFTPRTSDNLFIGRRPPGDINNYAFTGQIDEVGIYRRALTPAEILAIYNASHAGKCPPMALPPGIAQQPQSIITNVNANVRFDVVATGVPTPSFQWFFAGNPLPGQTSASLLLNNVQPGQAGEYFAIATNNFGAVTSSVATLTVLTFPPGITRQPASTNVFETTATSFSVLATGSVTLAYQWFFNELPLAGKIGATLTFSSVQFSNAGNYFVIVTDPYGAVTSSVASLTVNPRPPCAPMHDGLVSWWKGENNALDNWDSNNGNNQFVNTTTIGKVGRAFINPFIAVNDSPSLRVTNGLTLEAWINPSSLASVRVLVSKFEYPLNQPQGTQSAYLLGTTNNGALFFTLTPNGSVRTNTTLLTTNLIPLNQWSHVAATYDGSVMRLYINGSQIGQTNHVGKIFPGNTPLGIGGFAGGTSSPWQYSGLMDEVSLYNRALSAAEIQAIVNADLTGKCLAPPVVTQQPQDQAVPLGEDVKFTVSVSGSRPLAYQWYFNGSNPQNRIIGATNAALIIEKVRTNNAGLYFVNVTNAVGSTGSARAQLSTLPAPACTEMLPGLISWWPGNSNTLDVLGLNNIASYSLPNYPTGKVASAFTFNGTSSRITINNSPSLNFGANTNFSIEMWIRATNSPVQAGTPFPNVPLFEKRTTPTTGWVGYSLSLNQGRLAFAMGTQGIVAPGATSNYISSGPDLRDAMFHHVAVTVNRSATNGGVLYVDGVPVLTFNPKPLNVSLVNTSPLFIGAPSTTFSNSYYTGLIDEPAIYNRDLTAAEILSIRTAGASGRCTARPVIVTQPVGGAVAAGSNFTLNVVATGTPPPRYQWRQNSVPLSGATNSFLNLTNISKDRSGTYSVIVSNAFGSVTSSNAVVVISNRPPNAFPASVVVNEDSPGVSVILTGSDPDGNPLFFAIVSPPTNGTFVGVLTGSGTTYYYGYRPNPNYHGPDGFTFKVNDGSADSAPATVSIMVNPVNDPPVAHSQLISTDEDTPVTITLQASDIDGDALTYALTQPMHGTLSGTPPNLVYTPVANFFGDDLFTFTVRDGSNAVSQLAAVSITVLPVNDAPVAKIAVTPLDELPGVTNLIAIAPVCCEATIRLDASESTDVENDSLTYAWLEGTNVLSSEVTTTNRFAPGTHTFTLLVSDGTNLTTATVTLEIIKAAEAVDYLQCLVEASITERRTRSPLVNWLRQAEESFERCRVEQGVHFLELFQRRVQDRIAETDPELAASLIDAAEAIIEAAPDCDPCHRLGRPDRKRDKHQDRDDRPDRSEGRSSGR